MPLLIRGPVFSYFSKKVGREVVTNAVYFSPLNGKIALEGLSFVPVSGEQFAPVHCGRVEARLSLIPLLQGKLSFFAFRAEKPAVRLHRFSDGRLNLSPDVFTRIHQTVFKPQGRVRLVTEGLQVINGTVEFDDRPSGRQHKVEEINIKLPSIGTGTPTTPFFQAVVNGSPLRLSSDNLILVGGSHQFSLQLHNMQLANYSAYISPWFGGSTIRSGEADCDLQLSMRDPAGDGLHLDVEGNIVVR
jgi:hypothetical protein